MNPTEAAAIATDKGATLVITHRVRLDKHAEYEQWLEEIVPRCQVSPGCLDWHIIRPIRDATETYTVIIRFDTEAHLVDWVHSSARNELIAKVRPLLVTDDDFYISSGLDFWFTPAVAKAKIPTRWKQYLVTWSAIYPLVLIMPLLVLPLLRLIGIPENCYTDMLFITGVLVALMIYVIMPRYTRLIHHWLFE